MAGILYVVATPIGNLEDVTLRALRILREVSLIAAEDTRRTARLLQHYSISTRTTSLHEHNEREKTPKLVERLRAGDSMALVSDAGTPLISDPGQTLVAAARDAGIRVEAVPGPSAVMAALSSSGLPARTFTFLGFPPNRSKDRIEWLRKVARMDLLVVFFEAPHRILQTLDDLQAIIGPDRIVGVGRELTKAHEELVIRPISDLLRHFTKPLGEFTVLIPPSTSGPAGAMELPSVEELRQEIGQMTDNLGLRGRDALKVLADRYGTTVNALYRLISEPPTGGRTT
ncbi:MAG TPA: 16S rRNA (cytidine(1402)-2'-O)-methyltransferase, partial [Xanthobacteraceae bacterium]|nr:16S rRNA (cytidine(1402)-2'-O)-methyltransferase [Xanthobacteraceae bacterium]